MIDKATLRQKKQTDKVDYIFVFTLFVFLTGAGLFGFFSTLMFLIVGGFYVVLNFKYALAAYKNNWFIFMFGLVGVLSVFWAEYPLAALRTAIQYLLTVGIFLVIIYCVNIDVLFKAISTAMLLVMVFNVFSSQTVEIAFTGEVVKVGYFGSKNNMALVAGFAALSGLGVFMFRASMIARILAGTCVFLSLITFFQARSLGSSLSLALVIILSITLFMYSRAGLLNAVKSNINFFCFLAFIFLVFFIVLLFDYSVYESFMYGLGKDPTITGRTNIWAIGFESIGAHPILGVGQSSYWNLKNIGALEIWEMTHREEGSPFGFHNQYIHTYVELGLFGFLAVSLVFIKLFIAINTLILKEMRAIDIVVMSFFLVIFLKSFFETVGFSPFSLSTFFLCLSWVHMRRSSFYDKPACIKLRLN
ncbi:O-antigen ligase family protein [Neptuniibacter marinus]|uniref:O-antigen ligase family protein n=1 Tax=Neptuniibacter marinus TaxID=1806670 RepID=UPI0008310D25|nr:O-antigen ligase family protein [Neptuniibacter marinus]